MILAWLSLFIIYILTFINKDNEFLRFESLIANHFTFLICLSIPIFLTIFAFYFNNCLLKIYVMLFSMVLILFSLLLGSASCFFNTINWDTGADPSFVCLKSIKLNHSQVSVYRTDGGALSSFGVLIRQEMAIFPRVLLVKRLDFFYPAYEAKINLLSKNKVEAVIIPSSSYRDQPEKTYTFIIKDWVYF
jgi:hypothetical protein